MKTKTVLPLEQENVQFLEEKKLQGISKTYVINQALKEYKKNHKN